MQVGKGSGGLFTSIKLYENTASEQLGVVLNKDN